MLTKQRATRGRRDMEVSIKLSELHDLWINQNGKCAITNLEMDCKKSSPYCLTLDRIDSDLGYITGNVQLVCHCINLAKWKWPNETIKEVIIKLRMIASHLSPPPSTQPTFLALLSES